VDLDTAVVAAQDGDETAFRVVYRAVQPQLLSYVRSLVGPADAEDVASEAWLQIARDLPSFRGDGASVRGWAARIARNRALDHIRARSRRPVSGAGVDELIQLPGRADTAGEALDAVATDRALAAIAALPREQAEAVMLRVVMGLDSTSAARVLGKRAGSVRMATHRGLRRLAEVLEADTAGAAGANGSPGMSGAPGTSGGSGPDASGGGGRAGERPGDRGGADPVFAPGPEEDAGGGGRRRADVTLSASKAL
jgi:RNA polymerase sigma-70 factor (ECF subfamily)